jgi:FMN phosphatase YigB (HAD superfamily)
MMNKTWEAIFFDASGTLFREDSDLSSGVVLYEDAERVVECLRKREFSGRKMRTGLITNWSARVHQVLSELRLLDCFDVVVCSSDVEHGKPAAEPFVLAATNVGLDVSRCVHLGDSLRDDVFGSFDAGLDAIWINRRHRELHPPEKRMLQSIGHPVFGDLEEAKEYLENLMREGVR